MRTLTGADRMLGLLDRAFSVIASAAPAARPNPAASVRQDDALAPAERELAGALMRVNHVGEVCAQALYEGHAATCRDPEVRAAFRQAAVEEADHLAWTKERLDELGARPSLLNPLWYAGAFALGATAGLFGRGVALGFMKETEIQVERHLESHEGRLPAADARSRAIVGKMKSDEAEHAGTAAAMGAVDLPAPLKAAMRAAAKVMTTTAHRV